jgi:thiopurine S-methyltransferase
VQPEFWRERWRTGQIGFHQPATERNLVGHWEDLELAEGSRVFVPLCGKSLDLLWLQERGHVVTGVELSATALEAFCMENGIPAGRRSIDGFDLYEAPGIDLLRGDFFALTSALLGPISAVYDRAALISWADELRETYVEHMTALTRSGTQTLLITLEYPQVQMAGPPFSVDRDNVERLYARHHAVQELTRQDILEAEPRMRARGVTALFEVCYRLTRL